MKFVPPGSNGPSSRRIAILEIRRGGRVTYFGGSIEWRELLAPEMSYDHHRKSNGEEKNGSKSRQARPGTRGLCFQVVRQELDSLSNAARQEYEAALGWPERDPAARDRQAGSRDDQRVRHAQFLSALIAVSTSEPSFPRRRFDSPVGLRPDRRSLAANNDLARFIREAMVPSVDCKMMAASL